MNIEALQRELEIELMTQYGPIVSGKNLLRLLAFPSQAALRQALSRKLLPVPLFSIQHRRGKFALVKDLAQWIVLNRANAEDFDIEQFQPKGEICMNPNK